MTFNKYTAHQYRIGIVKSKIFYSVIPITSIFLWILFFHYFKTSDWNTEKGIWKFTFKKKNLDVIVIGTYKKKKKKRLFPFSEATH